MTMLKVVLVSLLTCSLFVSAAVAGPPLSGVFDTTDLGGDVNIGRYMESYQTPDGAVSVGTTLNAQSWDGVTLGLQWSYQCGVVLTDPILISDFVSTSGTGSRTYMKTFIGGTIWLSGTGPWGNGDAEYSGPILSYVEYETIQFVNWERTHAVTNVSATAAIDGYNEACLAFSVGNGVETGSTDFGHPVPTDYPVMLDGNCDPTDAYGAWWDFMTMSLYIDNCTVSTEATTWDALKSLYK